MLRTRLLLFARLYREQAGTYTLKLVSLAIAFACSILVGSFATREFTVNSMQPDDIVRVLHRNNTENYPRNRLSDRIPKAAHDVLRSSVTSSRVKVLEQLTVSNGNKSLSKIPFHAADTSVINVFDFDFIDGTIPPLSNGPTVLLSSSAAKQLFGNTEASDKILLASTISDTLYVKVAGVYADWTNCHEEFSAFLFLDHQQLQALGYTPTDFGVYARLLVPALADSLASRMTIATGEADVSYHFQPLKEIYFGPRVLGESARHGDLYSVWILLCISGLIAFLAITNYANLTTLTLPARSTELAISKVAGAGSLSLCIRLVQESVLMSAAAFIAGIALIIGSTPILQSVFSIDASSWLLNASWHSYVIMAVIFLSTLAAPLYPVIVFATAGPRRLLSADVISFPKFKRIITTFQLGISISLIIAGLIIERQISRSLLKEPGKNHDQIVFVKYPKSLRRLDEQKLAWKRSNPNIVEVTAASQLPNNLVSRDITGRFHKITIEHDFFQFFDIELEAGRTFRVNDEDSVMINQAAIELPEMKAPIGVIANFGSKFNQPEIPLQIRRSSDTDEYAFLFIRILEVNVRDTYAYLGRFFKMFTPEPVKIGFLDTGYLNVLHYEDTLNGLSRLLTTIGIAMACCAMLALGLSRVNDNLKAIAIRRTFGASRSHIVYMMSREFVEELFIAVLFFGPVTFILLREWLRNFVYAARFHWADPLLALAACVVIIILTSSLLIIQLGKKTTAQTLRR